MAVQMKRREAGASLVEFALIAPLVFALLLGMFTGGLSLSRKNSMTNAVREGARLGATLDESSDWAEAVRTRVVALSGGDLAGDQVCVALVKRESATTVDTRQATSCPVALASGEPSDADIPEDQCAVKVWAGRSSDLNVIFFNRQLDLEAATVSRYERAGEDGECTSL